MILLHVRLISHQLQKITKNAKNQIFLNKWLVSIPPLKKISELPD